MKAKLFNFIIAFALSLIIISCNESGKINQKIDELNVVVDESIYNLVKEPLELYDSVFTSSRLKISKANASEAMALLLSGKCQSILTSRLYTPKEDSLMKVYNVAPHSKEVFAKDALVFFVDADFPLDTITDEQLFKLLTHQNTKLVSYYPKLKTEPNLVINNINSSEYYNLKNKVARNQKITHHLKFYNSYDSVLNHIRLNKSDIGIGYLSQIVKNGEFKALAVSFIDSTGKYIPRKQVHQAWIIQGFYPYIVEHYAFIEDSKDFELQGAFLRYISKNGKVQRYFNDYGIVPAYAKVKIIDNN